MGVMLLHSLRSWFRYLDVAYPEKPADYAAYMAALRAKLSEPGRMAEFLKTLKTSPADAGAALPRISCPALVIMGTEDPDWADPRAEAEGIVAAMPAGLGAVAMIKGGGHYPHAQCPDEVAALIDLARCTYPDQPLAFLDRPPVPRAGLNTDRVVAEAAELADEVGLDQLTLAALAARLGVRQPSLYKHVASIDALQRLISMRGKAELADVLGRAAIGRARDDALVAMAHAWRAWALDHPGRYQAAERGAAPGDAEHEEVSRRTITVLVAVMDGYGLDGDDAVDAIRAYRAALHGFVSLEANYGFAFPSDVDRSFDRLVHALVRALSSWSDVSEPAARSQPAPSFPAGWCRRSGAGPSRRCP